MGDGPTIAFISQHTPSHIGWWIISMVLKSVRLQGFELRTSYSDIMLNLAKLNNNLLMREE